MKQLIFIALMFSFTGGLFGQVDAIDKYFHKYKDNDDFTVVYISPKMFSLISKLDDDDLDDATRDAVKGIRSLKILTRDDAGMSFYEEAKSMIDTKEYEVLMTVRDDSTNVDFLVKDEDGGNIVNELLLLVGGHEDFVLLSFLGDIHLNKLSKIAESIDLDGIDHLDKLDDNNRNN